MRSLLRIATTIALAGSLIVACGDDDSGTPVSALDARIDELFAGQSFGTLNRDMAERMLTVAPQDDEPFIMVNLIRHFDEAQYPDGRESDLTGRQADELYGAMVFPILVDIGASVVYVADVESSLADGDGDSWDQVGVVRYPSFAALIDMISRQDFRDAAIHKVAGVQKSLVLVANPPPIPFPPMFRQVDLDAVPYPPTEDDRPIGIVHLIRYNETAVYEDGRATDLSGREAMRLYEQGRADQGTINLGVRPGLWIDIDDALISDGRPWDEFRINNFPSRATFAEVASPESLKEAGIEHRLAALADTYALLTAPILTTVGYE